MRTHYLCLLTIIFLSNQAMHRPPTKITLTNAERHLIDSLLQQKQRATKKDVPAGNTHSEFYVQCMRYDEALKKFSQTVENIADENDAPLLNEFKKPLLILKDIADKLRLQDTIAKQRFGDFRPRLRQLSLDFAQSERGAQKKNHGAIHAEKLAQLAQVHQELALFIDDTSNKLRGDIEALVENSCNVLNFHARRWSDYKKEFAESVSRAQHDGPAYNVGKIYFNHELSQTLLKFLKSQAQLCESLQEYAPLFTDSEKSQETQDLIAAYTSKISQQISECESSINLLRDIRINFANKNFLNLVYSSQDDDLQKLARKTGKTQSDQCTQCDKSESLKQCARCKTAVYCSATCQKKHWKEHRPFCHENHLEFFVALPEGAIDAIVIKDQNRQKYLANQSALHTGLVECSLPDSTQKFELVVKNNSMYMELMGAQKYYLAHVAPKVFLVLGKNAIITQLSAQHSAQTKI